MNTLPSWSYTALSTFEECPRKYYHRYILREKEPETEALRYGKAVHTALENRIKGEPLPECYMRFSPMVESIVQVWQKGMKVYTELKMGLARDFTPSGFFDSAVWGRGAADVVLKKDDMAMVFDWKTGKKREKPDQLKILSLFIFKHFPQVQEVGCANIWLESGEIGTPYSFTRAQEPVMWQDILSRLQRMEKAFVNNAWPEMPSGLCGFCSVKACQYNRS